MRTIVMLAAVLICCGYLPISALAQDAAKPAQPTPDRIEAAVKKGVDFLRGCLDHPGNLSHRNGSLALAGLALLECGVPPDDPLIRRATERLREVSWTETATYHVALFILYFDKIADPANVPLIQLLGVRLLAGQQADGGWGYNCGSAPEPQEVHRLRTALGMNPALKTPEANNEPAAAKQTTPAKPALPPEIQRQLLLLNQTPPARRGGMTDNSNTQFAIMGVWALRRHGLPVAGAIKMLETRFRQSQTGGGWGYTYFRDHPTPAMTCAGLIGLAVGIGERLSPSLRLAPPNSPNPNPLAEQLKQPRPAVPAQPASSDPNNDPAIRAGLLLLGQWIQPNQPPANQAFQLNLRNDFYFFWSLERVGVAYGLRTIGNVDWYDWGAKILLDSQRADGAWQGKYQPDVDTSFALLFLRRANLTRDLSASLTGKIRDPGTAALKSGGVGGEDLLAKLPRTQPSEPPATKTQPSEPRDQPPLVKPTEPAQPIEPKDRPIVKRPSPTPPDTPSTSFDTPATPATSSPRKLAQAALAAQGIEQLKLLQQLMEGKGNDYTEALAWATAQLTGPAQAQARDLMTQRMCRMTVTTLRAKLADPHPEVRRAAALAFATREDRSSLGELVLLLEDHDPLVVRAARTALRTLTGQDFGPEPTATPAQRARVIASWRDWLAANRRGG